ncbi:cobalamin B12-binding domain-containing protein [Rhodococcoides fascians]|uniref:cobalamin B12-binding domain-containing protein n=1 Tax=Rhodococcoides fascians TaxID=1828 RepID=UPI00068B2EAE|nr:cobalamin B12-binding domain-containing protein [Rhodococcus fascians]
MTAPNPSFDPGKAEGRVHRVRVVVAKPGLDGHDRGAKVVARALRDAGMEVIYTGLRQTPEQIVRTTLEEGADAVGLSLLSGAHMELVPRVIELLAENNAMEIPIFCGGVIPPGDARKLAEMGVLRVFTSRDSLQEITRWAQTNLHPLKETE